MFNRAIVGGKCSVKKFINAMVRRKNSIVFFVPILRALMLKLANDYDKLADRAEDRAARDTSGPSPIAKERQ